MAQIPTDITLTQPTVDLGRLPTAAPIPDKTSLLSAAGSQIASTMGNLGQSVEGLGAELQEKQNQADDYEAKKQFVNFDLAQDQALQTAQRNTTGDPNGFTKTFMGGYDDAAKGMLANVPENLKPQYDYLLSQRADQYTEQAQNFENKAADQYHLTDVNTQTNTLRNAVAQSPTPENLQTNIARGVSLIDSSHLPFEIKDKTKREFASQIAEDAIRARIGNGEDPESIMGDIAKAPAYGGFSNPEPDFRTTSSGVAASIRNNNPGAMWPGPSAQKYGAVGEETLRTGNQVNKIATFPDAISGAAAQFDLLSSQYSGKTLLDAVKYWAGNNNVPSYLNKIQQDTGLTADTKLTPELLRDPEVAIPLVESMASHEAGKPYPLNDAEWRAAFNRANNVAAADTKVASADLPAVDPNGGAPATPDNVILADPGMMNSPYRFLSPMQRRTLTNVARVAGRATAMTRVDNDIAQIKRTGAPTLLPDGRTSLEKANPLLTPIERQSKQEQWHEAELEHMALSPLPNMSEDEMLEHIGTIVPDAGAADYATRVKVSKLADAAMTKILEQRRKDPALAVQSTPEVQNAFDNVKKLSQVPDGTQPGSDATVSAGGMISPQKANQLVIDARLQAQRRLGMSDSELSPITKKEANDLIGADFSQLSDQDVPKVLKAASQKADQKYGSYSEQVFKKAVSMVSKDKRIKDAIGPIVRKMLNENEIDDSDLQDAQALSQAATSDQLFTPDQRQDMGIAGGSMAFSPQAGSFAKQSPDQPGWFGTTVPSDGAFNTATPAKTIAPPPEAVAYLKKNPSMFQQFDAKYGPGSAAAYLRR